MENKAYTSSFASIYDDIMGAVPYNLWYDYLHEIMDYYKLKANKVLDLACGTGNMSILFAQNDYQVTGIDISKQMLDEARKKVDKLEQEIEFIDSDLRSFNMEKKFDMAFCLFDSLNYILNIEELERVFENVYRVLNEEGSFIFDMNTIRRLMSIKAGTTVIHGDNYSCIWEDIIDHKRKLWQVKLKIYLKELAEYHEELHQETGYKIQEVKDLLRKVGFKYVDVYNSYTFSKADDNDNRIYFIAFMDRANVREKPALLKSVKNVKWGFKKLFSDT